MLNGSELGEMIDKARVSNASVGRAIGKSRSLISHVRNGRRILQPEDEAKILTYLRDKALENTSNAMDVIKAA